MRLVWLRRLVFILMIGCLVVTASSQPKKKKATPGKAPIILFVCEHGAAKSVIAAAYFNKIAKQRGLKYKAIFRGTNPDPAISPVTKQGLIADGFESSDEKPSLVTQTEIEMSAQIITMGCKLPNADKAASKLTEWNEIPSTSNYPLARNDIQKRVQNLVDELAKIKNHK